MRFPKLRLRFFLALSFGVCFILLALLTDVLNQMKASAQADKRATQLVAAQPLGGPGNDTCAAAVALTINTPVFGSTISAANDYELSGTTCFTGVGQTSSTAPGRDVVYSFTAPSTNVFSFKVTNFSSLPDLVLYATTSCPAATPGVPVALTCDNISGPAFVASNRSTSSSSEELMCLSLTAGQQVFIFVDGNVPAGGAASTFTIEAAICVRETESNGTPATADSFGTLGIEGSINSAGDIDFYSLGVPGAGVRIFAMVDSVAANTTDFDLRVTTTVDTLEYDDQDADTLFGALGPAIGGTPVSSASSVFLRLNHNSAATAAEPYRLYFTVQPPGANPLANCPAVTTSATAETEPNDTSAQAGSAVNSFFSGSLAGPAPSTDLDVFSFSASAGQVVFVSLDGDPCRNNTPIDARLELLDTNGSTVIASVNDGGSTSNTSSGAGTLAATAPASPAEGLTFRVPAAGTYFVRVSIGTVSNGSTGAGDYLLSITAGGPTAADGTVSGRIVTDDGSPVSGAVVALNGTQNRKTITDAHGNYRFNSVETNGFYTVTPARANYNFNPFNRSFSLLGNESEAAFTGSLTGDSANPLDTPEFFVRQQYLDMLGREPDERGFNYWSDQILECGNDTARMNARRTDVAAAFFIAREFQETGSFLYDLYLGALGRRPIFTEYSGDRQQLIGGPKLELKKQAFAESFVQRAEFVQKYQAQATAASFVEALLQNVTQSSGVDLSNQRADLIARYNSGANQVQSRALVLRAIADDATFREAEYNSAFVLSEYFSYLRRNPDQRGYDFWLNVLNRSGTDNYPGMVCSFITSTEYQRRFSAILTRSNGDCSP